VVSVPANAPCLTGTDTTGHALSFTFGTDAPGKVTQVSADSVF
jgi:hypothetical protein